MMVNTAACTRNQVITQNDTGFDTSQRLAMDAGYDQQREGALLASIDWPNDGDRLFEIAALDGPSINGWLSLNGESNALFLPRRMWDTLGGVEERFDAPGGGFLNLDTFRRAVEMPEAQLASHAARARGRIRSGR